MSQLDQYVEQMLDEKMEPIELFYQPIYECYNCNHVAYRATTQVNSLIYGVLTPDEYAEASDMAKQGIGLMLASVEKAMRVVNQFRRSHRRYVEWVSVLCPTAALLTPDIYARLKELIDDQKFRQPNKICLEFGEDVLRLRSEQVYTALRDIKATGFKVAVRNCGTGDFSLADLLTFTPDVVFMNDEFIGLINDRDHAAAVPAMIRYVKALGIAVIAEGIKDDDMLREMNKIECFGFIPSLDYGGKFPCAKAFVKRSEITSHKEE